VSRSRILTAVGLVVFAAGVAWVLFVGLPRWTSRNQTSLPEETATGTPSAPAAPAPAEAPSAPRIKARLYYLSDDGLRLKVVEREVPLGSDPAAQARSIVEAQIAPAPTGFVSAIPDGTSLKQVFISDKNVAYVDLSGDIVKNHPGGSLDEILTIYTLVDAITDNLPAIASVQVLIDGHEVDTLAGHVDLRRPLAKNLNWVEQQAGPSDKQ
jgi:germination protein M